MQSDSSAVLIGVTSYRDPSFVPLPCAADDVKQLEIALEAHRDGAPNFDVSTFIVDDSMPWQAGDLLAAVDRSLEDCEHFLFYFSGHGILNQFGLQLVTPEKEHPLDSGVYFDALLHRFNQAHGTEVTVILDCCFSGAGGDRPGHREGGAFKLTHLRDGVSILASSGRDQASEGSSVGPSVFTQEVLNCLNAAEFPAVNVVELYNWASRRLTSQTPVLRTFGSQYSAIRAESREASQ